MNKGDCMKRKIFEKTRQVATLATLTLLLSNTGCGAALVDLALRGEDVNPLGNNKYQVTFHGVGEHKGWLRACKKTCNFKEFDIITSSQISNPHGVDGWTGIIQCKGDPKASEKIDAAGQQSVTVQYNLGLMHEKGKGVPQDNKQAFDWYRKAAERGFAPAQCNLGLMYLNGKGVPQDDKQAFDWCRKAAEQGIKEAQFTLGGLYYYGRGVSQDNVTSYAWSSLSAAQGVEEAAKYRDLAAKELTPEQRSKAQELAAELQAKIKKEKE